MRCHIWETKGMLLHELYGGIWWGVEGWALPHWWINSLESPN